MEVLEQEILEMRSKFKELPTMEENLSLISKSIGSLNTQIEKQQQQQQMVLKYIEGMIREKATATMVSEGSTGNERGYESVIDELGEGLKTNRTNEEDKSADRKKFSMAQIRIHGYLEQIVSSKSTV